MIILTMLMTIAMLSVAAVIGYVAIGLYVTYVWKG